MRRPGDDTPDPPGGRAAERMREELRKRGIDPDTLLPPEVPDTEPEEPSEENDKDKPRKDC